MQIFLSHFSILVSLESVEEVVVKGHPLLCEDCVRPVTEDEVDDLKIKG